MFTSELFVLYTLKSLGWETRFEISSVLKVMLVFILKPLICTRGQTSLKIFPLYWFQIQRKFHQNKRDSRQQNEAAWFEHYIMWENYK